MSRTEINMLTVEVAALRAEVDRSNHDVWRLTVHLAAVKAERDAANARADQAIRFAAQVEEECARLTGVLKEISFPGCAFYRSVFCAEREKLDGRGWCDPCIARSALTPIDHDLPSDTETGCPACKGEHITGAAGIRVGVACSMCDSRGSLPSDTETGS